MTTPTPPRPPLPNPNPYRAPTGYTPVEYTQPQGFSERMVNRIPAGARQVNIPNRLPSFLGDRATIFYSWMAAMILIGFDEWHNLHILPRPARLWDTSLLYGLLAAGAVVDPLVPIMNALAVGYTVMLVWQYYNGDLTPQGVTDTSGGAANTPGQQPAAPGAATGTPTPSGKLGPGGTIPK